jgi:phage-related minor tail protein
MRENLTQEEKDDLEDIINIYVKDKDYLERKIEKYISSQKEIVDLKEELLRGKHQFYKDLIIYIQIEKLEAFKQYVDSDLNYNEKSKDIQDKIEQKNVEQSERIDELRNQIDDNSMNFRRQIEEKITVQVSDKLDIFVNQESFQELSAKSKIKVFTNIINKFESAIDKLENTSNPTAVLAERII